MKKYNGTAWVDTTLRQYKTATADIEPTIYTDGTAITSYTIKGNTVQNGTPTPSAPIAVQGVGELETTGEHSGEYKIPILNAQTTMNIYLGSTTSTRQIQKLVLTGQENWTYDSTYTRFVITISGIMRYGTRDTPFYSTHYQVISDGRPIADVPNNSAYLVATVTDTATLNIKTDSYTSADDFKAFLSTQYSNGTPVTIWYILATATTGIVNEPLMKIGTYYDSISNAVSIPTTDGANSITVDTTVQPSEFTATWTGWHDSSVKEWDGTDWQ